MNSGCFFSFTSMILERFCHAIHVRSKTLHRMSPTTKCDWLRGVSSDWDARVLELVEYLQANQ